MQITKINQIRVKTIDQKKQLYNSVTLKEEDIKKHIERRIEEVKSNFCLVNRFFKMEQANHFQESFAKIIQCFILDNELIIKNKNINRDHILFLNLSFEKQRIKSFIMDKMTPNYKKQFSNICNKIVDKQSYFKLSSDITKIKDINHFFFITAKSYYKNWYINNLTNINGNKFENSREHWLKIIYEDGDCKGIIKVAQSLLINDEVLEGLDIFKPEEIFTINHWNHLYTNTNLLYGKKEKQNLDRNKLFLLSLSVKFLKDFLKQYKRKYLSIDKRTIKEISKKIERIVFSKIKNYFSTLFIREGKKVFINPVTSKDYEIQKAKDELSQRINIAVSFAFFAISRMNKDIFQEEKLNNCKGVVDKNILKMYFSPKTSNRILESNLFVATSTNNRAQPKYNVPPLTKIRNSIFHFFDSGTTNEEFNEIFNLELNEYQTLMNKKLKMLQIHSFYLKNQIEELFNNWIIPHIAASAAYLPGFKCINDYYLINKLLSSNETRNNAQIYLLKKVYQTCFTNYFLTTCFHHNTITNVEMSYRERNMEAQFNSLRKEAGICFEEDKMFDVASKAYGQYTMVNATSKNEKSKHYSIILKALVTEEFQRYISKEFSWILEKTDEIYVNEDFFHLNYSMEDVDMDYFILGKLIPNTIANDLVNTFAKHRQFMNDINRRYKVNEIYNENNSKIKALRVAIEMNDALLEEEQSQLDMDTIKDFIDYSDEKVKNFYLSSPSSHTIVLFKTLRILEKNGAKKLLVKAIKEGKINKINGEDIKKYHSYYKEEIQEIYNRIQTKNIDKEEWAKVNEYEAIHNRVEFHDFYLYSSILIEMQSQAVSYAYKLERDQYYFLLGVEKIKSDLENKELNKSEIDDIFTCLNGGTVNKSLNKYLKLNNKTHLLHRFFFGELTFNGISIRNKIEHFEIFKEINNNTDEKMIDQYWQLYNQMLSYDRKIKNNLFPKVMNTLEKYSLLPVVQVNNTKNPIIKFDLVGGVNTPRINFNAQYKQEYIVKKELKITNKVYYKAPNKIKEYSHELFQFLGIKNKNG